MYEKIESGVLGLTAILNVVISLVDWLGLLENKFLASRVPSIILLALGLVKAYLVLERRNKLDKIEHLVQEGIEQIIRSVNGVNVQSFADQQEFFNYVAKRMSEEKKTVDDLSWWAGEVTVFTRAEGKVFDKYINTIPVICKKGVRYREVASISIPSLIEHSVLQELKKRCNKTKKP